jgi:hypothetical protein
VKYEGGLIRIREKIEERRKGGEGETNEDRKGERKLRKRRGSH